MDFTIRRDVFSSAIQKTLGIVEKKTTMPILSNLLLRAIKNEIVIMATDMEIGLIATYEADIKTEGEITLPAKKFYEMVREIQGETIHVSKTDKDVVVLKSNKATYRILGMPVDDYPVLDESITFPLYPIKGAIFHELMKKTYFSIANDELRKNLNGAFLEIEKTGDRYMICMVSTDGHRLSLARFPLDLENFFVTSPENDVIIPKKGIGEMMRLLEDSENEEVFIGIGNGVFVTKVGNTTLKERLIDGAYPDYKRIIPVDQGARVTMDRNQLLHAVRRMLVMTSEKNTNMIMTLSADKVSLNSANSDIGEADDEIETKYGGEEISIGYNVKYIAEAIEVVEEDTIDFEINGSMKPTMIRGSGNENYLCIVMPLKIN
jgi:DNA polymerase III subunit beta